MQTVTSKAGAFIRSLALLAFFAVGVPWLLITAAIARFDGPAPWSAMSRPSSWDAIGSGLTERLSETTLADVVIRVGLTVAWVATVVLLVTVVLEAAHMVRHAGLPMPSVRGLGVTQHLARLIATGLLVVVPMLPSPNRAIAQDPPLLAPSDRQESVLEQRSTRPENAWLEQGRVAQPDPSSPDRVSPVRAPTDGDSSGVDYVVRPGDSIYSIANRLAGPDQRAIADYADRLLDLNLDRQMTDGQWFTNAAYIDVGWVLQLPSGGSSPDLADDPANGRRETVELGDSLWSIAEDQLGDGARWREIYDLNAGRVFDDGRELRDPNLIHPGWELDLPSDDDPVVAADAPPSVAPDTEAVPVVDESAPDVGASAPADVAASGTQRDPGTVPHRVDATDPSVRPDNVWLAAGASASTSDVPPGADGGGAAMAARPGEEAGSTEHPGASDVATGARLLTFERAAMLSAGLLALLAVRRRASMRRARPHSAIPAPAAESVAAERALRSIDGGDRFARVDIGIRNASLGLVDHQERVLAVAIDPAGDLELYASGTVELARPWEPIADAPDRARWRLAASTPIELLVDDARRVGSPCPTLVQLGRDVDGRDVYVDLEALEAIEIGGPGGQADAIVAAIAATLAASVLAEVTTLVGVGVGDDAFLAHRHHRPARDVQDAFEVAATAVGSTALAEQSTFELRTRATSGETWEPAVILAGAAAGTVTPPRRRTGLAVVSASPIHGPSARLAPDGETWTLLPLGLRLAPIGLTDRDVAALAELVAVPEPVDAQSEGRATVSTPFEPDATLLGPFDDGRLSASTSSADDARDDGELDAAASDDGVSTEVAPGDASRADRASGVAGQVDVPALPCALVVRLLGPVSVESVDGGVVDFERSKTKELVAWLATHRDRATRSNARSALWDLDVRDSTFANVVSEARRALARLVEPPEGDEWVGRTMTDSLPLHPLVVTDVDLIEHALETARLQPPNLAIETLAPAVEWVTGVPFEGTSYLWPDAEGITSDLVLRAITVTNALAAHCLSVGDIDGVFAATGRGLQVLPAHEDMIAVRMRAYARVGDRAGVRHEWETYERAIVADPWSDGEPSDRMLDLRRELLSG